MRQGESNRLEEFWRNQNSFGPGTRITDGALLGFILDWNVTGGLPLQGNFSVLYDNGDYREYDVFYFRYVRGMLNSASRWMNESTVVKSSYRRYCENVFLAKLRDE